MQKRNLPTRMSLWTLALFGGLLFVSGLFWLDGHMEYQAESVIVVHDIHGAAGDAVLAKSVVGMKNTDQFMRRTLGSSRVTESDVAQQTAREQLTLLVKKVSVTNDTESGIIHVTATLSDGDIATLLVNESVETLMRMTRATYKDGVTIEKLDEPVITNTVLSPWQLLAKSVLTALGLMLLGSLFLGLFGSLIQRFRNRGKKVVSEDVSRDERFVPQKIDANFLLPDQETTETEVTTEEHHDETPGVAAVPRKATDVLQEAVYGKPVTGLQSVSVAMEDLPFTFETGEPTKEEAPKAETVTIVPETVTTVAEEVVPSTPSEPSVEEYKKRLNELLSQK